MNINKELLQKLQQIYTNLLEDKPEDGYYHLYYGEYGPYSTGNYDDCYNQGFEAGDKDGKLEILKMLFEG